MFEKIELVLKKNRQPVNIKVSNLTSSGITYLSGYLINKINQNILLIVDDTINIPHIVEELNSWKQILKSEYSIFEVPDKDSNNRVGFFQKIISGKHKKIVIINAGSISDLTISKEHLDKQKIKLKEGKKHKRNVFIETLISFGFSQEDEISRKSEFSVRGEIIDIWPQDFKNPVRLVYDEDIIENMYTFNPVTQRRDSKISDITITTSNEPEDIPILNYFPCKEYMLCYELSICKESGALFKDYNRIEIESFVQKGIIDCNMQPMVNFQNNWDFFERELKRWIQNDYKVVIVTYSKGEQKRIQELLGKTLIKKNKIIFIEGYVRSGFIIQKHKYAIVTEYEIFNRYVDYNVKNKEESIVEKVNVFDESAIDFNPGDFVVHSKYGIGRFLGLKRISASNRESDFITIEYAKNDKLYVPLYDFTLVHRYMRKDEYTPVLNALDTKIWEKIKEKVVKKINEMANEIIELQVKRKTIPGMKLKDTGEYEKNFAQSFIYEETPDQKRSIDEVLADMALPNPMERLVCGDVGYGKTEVAIRASFRAVMNGKQVVMLVPTTLLTEQHYNTFKDRYADYPVKVAMLSRFCTKSEKNLIYKGLADGDIDIVISTHGILRESMKFSRLGLVIVDEEHRFGVKAKERLKKMCHLVDILMLSATPIPRTLSMGLSGVRDISVIETPPPVRQSITTYIKPYEETIVRDALSFELLRSGQVFYVYNYVEGMQKKYNEIKKIMPGARIAIAHGRMHNRDLENVMHAFLKKEIDILIATTIVESGLDIPSVNMMVIDGVQNLGLAQLYQLRGRVGRGYEKAFCYMLYPKKVTLTETSIKRLQAIQEFAGLGSGFKLALRDLEIRGAGNILGRQQHGYIKEIGFELYCNMLNKALHSIKQKDKLEDYNPEIQMNAHAYFPEYYMKSGSIRISFYKKLLNCDKFIDIKNVKNELIDRFGRLPFEVTNLLILSEIKILAKNLRISILKEQKDDISIFFRHDSKVSIAKLLAITKDKHFNIKFDPYKERKIIVYSLSKKEIEKLFTIKKVLQAL